MKQNAAADQCVRAEFLRAGTIQELKSKGRLVVRGAHRPILVVEGGCCTDVPNFPWRAEGDRRQAISAWNFIVPFKHHSKGRRHIPRQKHRVTNWRDYDTALRDRGSLHLVHRGGAGWLEGAVSKDAGWAASLFKPRNRDRFDATSGVPVSSASERRADRLDHAIAGDRPSRSRSFDAKSSGWWAAGSEPTTFWSSP